MKNVAIIIVLFLFGQSINAQLQEESFSSSELPQGWQYKNETGSSQWQFGYNGVMPYSGPTIESEFSTGAALFNDGSGEQAVKDRISLLSPKVDISQIEDAYLEVTYNLQVTEEKGEFTIEVYDGNEWQRVYFQDSSSPKNTGMNEMVSLEVGDFLNDSFQVRFTYDDEGEDLAQGLGIDHYKLSESSSIDKNRNESLSVLDFLNLTDNVLVLDANQNMDQLDDLHNLGEHLKGYELSTDSVMYNISEFPGKSYMFRVQEDNNVGSFKVLTK